MQGITTVYTSALYCIVDSVQHIPLRSVMDGPPECHGRTTVRYCTYFITHSMDRKAWPTMKVKRKLVATVTDCPADRVSIGWISDGTSHARGPHESANPLTYIPMSPTRAVAMAGDTATLLPPNEKARTAAIATCSHG